MRDQLGVLKVALVLLLARIARYMPDRSNGRWIAGAATGVGVAGVGANALLSSLGFSAVAHSSGVAILTGTGGYIAGTYGVAAVIGILTAPLIVLIFIICIGYGFSVLLKQKLWRKK